MYNPIQIPYILNKTFASSIQYTEEMIPQFLDFIICLWEMQPISKQKSTVENIIVADGCIDLVVDYNEKQIGFAGMSKTDFNFKIYAPSYYYGVRFKPGAFYAITGIHATDVMNTFLLIKKVDQNFDVQSFFKLSFSEAKIFIKNYIRDLIQNKVPDNFTSLFDKFNDNIPLSVSEIYKIINYSPKQCQRLFYKHFGLSPQMSLCIIRFQKCLEFLITGKTSPNDVLNTSNFYDQSHFINDFKKNIGLTPFELVRKYEKDEFLQYNCSVK